MANPFGGFVHTSPLSSLPHDATLTLASNCIRDYFGPTVQTVADCLKTRGGASTFAQLVAAIRGQCRRVWNEERERLVSRVAGGKYKLHRARGPATSGYVVEVEAIREALLILIQHSLVRVDTQGPKPTYRFLVDRARLLPRYPRYIEYGKKALDETASALLEELLINGRMMTVDAIVATVNRLQESGTGAASVKSEKYTLRQAVVESFHRLVLSAFIEKVQPLKMRGDEKEYEFEGDTNSSNKVIKVEENQISKGSKDGDDPAVVTLLSQGPYRNVLHRNTVWRVNIDMFHETSRAFSLGRLVAERFGQKVQSSGSMITAALKLAAHKKHVERADYERQEEFTPDEIVEYLPRPVQQVLEKKPGGIIKSLSRALVEMSLFTHPTVVVEVEEAMAHPKGGKFAIATRELVDHLRDRIFHQVVLDSHGEVSARICSILTEKGYLEADAIAETAMVPAKDTREELHKLYRANYVTLFTLQQSKHHNPASMIYLWRVEKQKMQKTVTDNVCRAITNMRLRRQHEESVGKGLIELAKEANDEDMDVNEEEMDKANYTKFCLGLERLDNAILQLDETLMVLLDF